MKSPTVAEVCRLADRLDAAGREAVKRHLRCKAPKTLTNAAGNGYNARMVSASTYPLQTPTPDASIGRKIAKGRHEKAMSQEELGEKVGLTRVSIARIETGKQNPSIPALRTISRVLELSLHDLLAAL